MEKVIPRGINYADIKPEAIENMIKVVRFTPTATVNYAKPNDIIRFQLMGNGFFDPYSAYIQIEAQINMADLQLDGSESSVASPGYITNPTRFVGRFLDRSAHSFINRLVIKSQGTELERIEHYDIMAAMINDMLYSEEQAVLHHFEGFANKSIDLGTLQAGYGTQAFTPSSTTGNVNLSNAGTPLAELVTSMGNTPAVLMPQMNQDPRMRFLCDQGWWKFAISQTSDIGYMFSPMVIGGQSSATVLSTEEPINGGYLFQPPDGNQNVYINPVLYPNGNALQNGLFGYAYDLIKYVPTWGNTPWENEPIAGQSTVITSPQVLTFCIPIYSGLIGVLMPDKKMLPLSLMPLELEFTVNPYAIYGVNSGTTAGSAANDINPRDFTITKFWIFSHVLYFEQELHRSLEAVVAENGIFIHFSSFYLAPIATHTSNQVQNYAQINIHAKSITSVHFVFIYTGWEQANGSRKLNFVNHNLSSLQIRNGTELTPSELLTGDQYSKKSQGQHIQFLLETFKAWNKMHDPCCDAAITPFNYCFDMQLVKPVSFYEMIMQQAQLGRCQYGISLQGEELGQDSTMVSGKKGLIPFDINMAVAMKTVNAVSFQFIYTKSDYIVYVRPDLVVTLLGR